MSNVKRNCLIAAAVILVVFFNPISIMTYVIIYHVLF